MKRKPAAWAFVHRSGALNGVDAEYGLLLEAMGIATKPMRIYDPVSKVNWTVAAAAGTEWAKKVFPKSAASDEAGRLAFGIKTFMYL